MLDMVYVTVQVCSIKIHNKANIEFCTGKKFMGNIQNFRDFHAKCSKNTIFEDEQMENTEILWMVKTSSMF